MEPKKYAIIENGIVVNTIVATQEFIDQNNLNAIEQPGIGENFRIGYSYENGNFLPLPKDLDPEWEVIRSKRNELLNESDIIVSTPDRWVLLTPEKQQEWLDYRQALRDLPQNFEYPSDIVWPTNPNSPKEEPLFRDLDPSDPDFIMEDPSDYGLDPNNLPQ